MNQKPLLPHPARPLEQASLEVAGRHQKLRWVLPRASPWGYIRSGL